MICNGCNNAHAYHVRSIYEDGKVFDVCNVCGDVRSIDASIPDVYWNGRPYYSEALECELTSRSQKARVMKEKGVSELGSQKLGEKSWTEGSREYRRRQFNADRQSIREGFKRWKETGYARRDK